MPYIKNNVRKSIDLKLKKLLSIGPTLSRDELVHIALLLLLGTNPMRYSDFNKLVGVLECAKREFCRRFKLPELFKTFKFNEANVRPEVTQEIVSFTSIDGGFTVGEMNYIITSIFLSTSPNDLGKLIILAMVFETAQKEFYQSLATLEDKKIIENGDVYPRHLIPQ